MIRQKIAASQTFALLSVVLAISAISLLPQQAHGQVMFPDNETDMMLLKGPYIDEEPFELVYLDDFNKNAIMKIVPLEQPLTKPYPAGGSLKFELANDREYMYQVPYNRIVNYKTYNDLLLEEAEQNLQKKEYSKAFRNLLYVYDKGGKDIEGLREQLQSCLFLDATDNFKNGRFELALSIYEDMYFVQPDFDVPNNDRTLPEIIMACYEGMLRQKFQEGNYFEARRLLREIDRKYESDDDDLQSTWVRRFGEESDKLIREARELAADGKGKEAHFLARRANTIFPGRKENADLYDDIVKQFPYIFVGVNDGAGRNDPNQIENWGSRRVGRLTQRSLIEFDGFDDEGGRYDFVGGQFMQTDENGLVYRFDITDEPEFAKPPITAYQISSRLREFGDYNSENYYIPWAKIIETVAIDNEKQVTFRLRIPFVRPEALLQIPLEDRDENDQPVLNGAYLPTEVTEEFTSFDLNPAYKSGSESGRQHPKIIERQFEFSTDAVDALIKGDIDLLDRVPLAELRRLKQNADIAVSSYNVPTVHMLVPNVHEVDPEKPGRADFLRNDIFRMGLLRGINREAILRDTLCGGEEIDGCEVLSGPWPVGTETSDQLAYGYDARIRPVAHNSKLGMVYVQLAINALEDRQREKGVENPQIDKPQMVLVHPANFSASVACAEIKRRWEEIGVTVDLRPLPLGMTRPQNDNWDFLYVAATVQEPLTDAIRLLGQEGFAKSLSAPTEQSLRMLSYANSWQSATSTLRRIHRQTSNDLAIIPLWQLNEHYAYRTNVREVGRNLIHLYQNVERWRIESTAVNPDP